MSENSDIDSFNGMKKSSSTGSMNATSQRTPRDKGPPRSWEAVYKLAEKEATFFNQSIESIFEKYNLQDGFQNYYFETMPNTLKTILDACGAKPNQITTYKEFEILCTKNSERIMALFQREKEYNGLCNYGEIVSEVAKLISNLDRRINTAYVDNLLRFCVSLSDQTSHHIAPVAAYHTQYCKIRQEILSEIEEIGQSLSLWKAFYRDWSFLVDNGVKVSNNVVSIRASLNKLYYSVRELVEEHKKYVRALQARQKDGYHRLSELKTKIHHLEHSIRSAENSLQTAKRQLLIDERIFTRLRKKLVKCRNSHDLIKTKLNESDVQRSKQINNLTAIMGKQQELEDVRVKNHKRRNSASKVCRDLKWTKNDRETMEFHITKTTNACDTYRRHVDRLVKLEISLVGFIQEKEEQVSTTRMRNEEQEIYIEKLKEKLIYKSKELDELMASHEDVKFIAEKILSYSIIREIYFFGRVIEDQKKSSELDRLSREVARSVGPDWRALYKVLPMQPDRSIAKRESDIENIETIAMKNDHTEIDQAENALRKWRLFFRRAEPRHLQQALKKMRVHHSLPPSTHRSRNSNEESVKLPSISQNNALNHTPVYAM